MLRLRPVLLCAATLLLSGLSAGAAVSPQRIVRPIDSSDVAEVPGNVPAAARRAVDMGAVAAGMQLTELSLRFSMTATQQAGLTQLLADQQNPASARYHQWLTPEQFGAQFGLAAADLQKVSSWLTAQGFTVTQVARGGTFIQFSGTAGQAANAFHTQLHRVTLGGESHVTNLTEPALPAAIAVVTNSITGLHDFKLKPHHREWAMPDEAGRDEAGMPDAAPGAPVTSPLYTSAASGNHFVAPGDFYTIYDENAALTGGIDGAGVTIAVAGQTDIPLAQVAAFRATAGLSATAPTVQLYGTDPGTVSLDLLEALLDVEWSGATAPGATILYVNSKNVIDGSLTQAIDNNLAPIVSLSYGLCESAVSAANLDYYNGLMQMANAQGQTVIAASGDSGATDCDYQVATATQGLSADFPAVLPSVTGVGGTMFVEGSGTYWGPNNGTVATALTYIPEMAWNEDSNGSLSSGGGGSSTFFLKPYWQVGAGVPADSARDVPDISLNAASSHDGYLVCSSGYCVDGWKNTAGLHDVVGGTSVGTPAFAGILALVEQKIGGRVGNANPTLYALANSTYGLSVFHDVTTGTNASPCNAGTVGCPAGGTIGYGADVGYDRATGLGTLDVFNLVNSWALVTPLLSTTGAAVSATTLTGAPTANVVQGTNINLTAAVAAGTAGVTAVPTGAVQFLVDSVAVGPAVALAGGGAGLVLDTKTVAPGAHTVSAAYTGDATFVGSIGTLAVTVVSSGVPDFTVVPAVTSLTVSAGGSASTVVTVNGLNSFAGTVTVTATTSSANFTASVSPATVTLSNTKTVGTTTLTVGAVRAGAVGAPSAAVRPLRTPWYGAGSGVAVAGLLMLVLPRRRKFVGALVAVLSVGMLAAVGCGSGGSAGNPAPLQSANSPSGTYTVTITAVGTSGATAVTHTATVTVIVP